MNVIVIMEGVIMRLDLFIVNVTLATHLMMMDWDVQVHMYIKCNKCFVKEYNSSTIITEHEVYMYVVKTTVKHI